MVFLVGMLSRKIESAKMLVDKDITKFSSDNGQLSIFSSSARQLIELTSERIITETVEFLTVLFYGCLKRTKLLCCYCHFVLY